MNSNKEFFSSQDYELLGNKSKYNALPELVKSSSLTKAKESFTMVSTTNDNIKMMFTFVPIRPKIDALSQFDYLRFKEYQYGIVLD